MGKEHVPFTNINELDEYLELAKELIERSQKHLKNINEIEDIHLKDEVWEHLAKNLDTLVEGLTNGVLSVQGRLVK